MYEYVTIRRKNKKKEENTWTERKYRVFTKFNHYDRIGLDPLKNPIVKVIVKHYKAPKVLKCTFEVLKGTPCIRNKHVKGRKTGKQNDCIVEGFFPFDYRSKDTDIQGRQYCEIRVKIRLENNQIGEARIEHLSDYTDDRLEHVLEYIKASKKELN